MGCQSQVLDSARPVSPTRDSSGRLRFLPVLKWRTTHGRSRLLSWAEKTCANFFERFTTERSQSHHLTVCRTRFSAVANPAHSGIVRSTVAPRSVFSPLRFSNSRHFPLVHSIHYCQRLINCSLLRTTTLTSPQFDLNVLSDAHGNSCWPRWFSAC